MARRGGKPGDWLVTDDYTGFTTYASKVKRDYWGQYAVKPLKRNLQEIASPLNDPTPVFPYLGPQYEASNGCIGETAPITVGDTAVPTNPNNMAFQVLNLDPGIGQAAVGCSLVVH